MKDICYKQNYLVEVIARLDFARPIQALTGTAIPNTIHDDIKKYFSIYEPGKIIGHHIGVTNDKVSSKKEEMSEWRYHGESREKSITISPSYIVANFKIYQQFEEFKENIINPIGKIVKIEDDIQVARTGLRFVNIYRGFIESFSDIKKYFHPMLSCSFCDLIDKDKCSRNFLISEYLHDDVKVRMQTGIYNPDYPAKIKKMDFIIDIDAFIDIPHTVPSTEELFDSIHEVIQKKFESCITDNLRKRLNK